MLFLAKIFLRSTALIVGDMRQSFGDTVECLIALYYEYQSRIIFEYFLNNTTDN